MESLHFADVLGGPSRVVARDTSECLTSIPSRTLKKVEQTVLHWADGALHGADGAVHGADAAVHWAPFLAQTTCCFSAVWSFVFSLPFR